MRLALQNPPNAIALVGAIISDDDGNILAAGCNEVPKFGGGAYWPGTYDHRDFQEGFDSSARYKEQIVKQVVDRFAAHNLFSDRLAQMSTQKIVEWIFSEKGEKILKGAQIFQLLEFGRPVHAEMMAITDAARRGISLQGMTLYCTTFPCHMCARHIISSGISKVVYIEPYPKSRVRDLYDDAVDVDIDRSQDRVKFRAFAGVAPRRYQEFFQKLERKDDRGHALVWDEDTIRPRIRRIIATYPKLEELASSYVVELLKFKGMNAKQESLPFSTYDET